MSCPASPDILHRTDKLKQLLLALLISTTAAFANDGGYLFVTCKGEQTPKTQRNDFAKHRIWAARTKDFKTFGKPFIYIEKDHDVIDTTIVRDSGKFYRFTRDERLSAVTMEIAGKLAGPWTEVPDFFLAKLVGYEGSECYLVEPAADVVPHPRPLQQERGLQTLGEPRPGRRAVHAGEGFNFPFKFRHGSILPLKPEEYNRLLGSRIPEDIEMMTAFRHSDAPLVDSAMDRRKIPVIPGKIASFKPDKPAILCAPGGGT